jgi:myo-inositol-1-phosphate synthase
MQAVFSQNYVKRLNGTNVKEGKNKMELAEQLIEDIARLKPKKAATVLLLFGLLRPKFFSKRRRSSNSGSFRERFV